MLSCFWSLFVYYYWWKNKSSQITMNDQPFYLSLFKIILTCFTNNRHSFVQDQRNTNTSDCMTCNQKVFLILNEISKQFYDYTWCESRSRECVTCVNLCIYRISGLPEYLVLVNRKQMAEVNDKNILLIVTRLLEFLVKGRRGYIGRNSCTNIFCFFAHPYYFIILECEKGR